MSEELKKIAGLAALDFVRDGMKLGIGTGSTAEAFIRVLAEKVADGLSIIGVPTSERTRALCESLNIPLTTLEQTPQLDLTIDGADEIDPSLALIKGGGGALLRPGVAWVGADVCGGGPCPSLIDARCAGGPARRRPHGRVACLRGRR